MNSLTLIPNSTKTMDSREIAELTGKAHAHVCRDIQAMLEKLESDQSKFGSVYKAGNGEDRRCYKLPYRETMILVSGYSVGLRARVVDRWMELERRMIPTTSVVGATTSLEIEEMTLKVISYHKGEADRLRAELTSAQPKIESFHALMRSEQNMTLSSLWLRRK